MTRALVIIDIQNDYFPGGKMELEGSDAASLRARELLAAFRERRLPIVHVQHISTRPGATFFLPDTDGARIHPNVVPSGDEIVIEKHFPNAFRETRLADHLRQIGIAPGNDELVLAGMMTHMCVDATTRAAADLGFSCSLAHDACATRSLSFGGTQVPADHVHCSFLSALHGTYAKVQSAVELVRGL
jgi:nicotinamidase-related amidase